MKNLSIDFKFITLPLNNFEIITTLEHKYKITNLINNFKEKEVAFSGRGDVFKYKNLIIRKYRHGGVFRKIFKDYFIFKRRFIDEFKIFYYLNFHCFPTSEVIGILISKNIFYNGYIVTGEITNVMELQDMLNENSFYNAGCVARRLHSLHVVHGDMHLKNFVLKESGEAYILDFDKSCFSDNYHLKLKDVKRFFRSVLKFNYFNENAIEKNLIKAFSEGYGIGMSYYDKMKVTYHNRISWYLNSN